MKLDTPESIEFLAKCKEYSVPMEHELVEQVQLTNVSVKGDYAHAALNGRGNGRNGRIILTPSTETLNAILKKRFSLGRYVSKTIQAMLTPSGNLVHFKVAWVVIHFTLKKSGSLMKTRR
jgi:hypothetical protein